MIMNDFNRSNAFLNITNVKHALTVALHSGRYAGVLSIFTLCEKKKFVITSYSQSSLILYFIF